MAENALVRDVWAEPQTQQLVHECEDFIASLIDHKVNYTNVYLAFYDTERIRLCFATDSYGRKPEHVKFFGELVNVFEKMRSRFYLLSFDIISVVHPSDPLAKEVDRRNDVLSPNVNVSRNSVSGFGVELLVLFPMNVYRRVGKK
ncbi:hypothetical protein [Lacunimicrobium album]